MSLRSSRIKFAVVALVVLIVAVGVYYEVAGVVDPVLNINHTYDMSAHQIITEEFNVSSTSDHFSLVIKKNIVASHDFALVILPSNDTQQFTSSLKGNFTLSYAESISNSSYVNVIVPYNPMQFLSTTMEYSSIIEKGQYSILLINFSNVNNTVKLDVSVHY